MMTLKFLREIIEFHKDEKLIREAGHKPKLKLSPVLEKIREIIKAEKMNNNKSVTEKPANMRIMKFSEWLAAGRPKIISVDLPAGAQKIERQSTKKPQTYKQLRDSMNSILNAEKVVPN
jgi:hypothetical protein